MRKAKRSGRLIATRRPCPIEGCGSSDAFAIYQQEDGSRDGTCFSCEGYTKLTEDGEEMALSKTPKETQPQDDSWVEKSQLLKSQALQDRGINENIARDAGILVECDPKTGEVIKHWYTYKKNGKVTGYKIRTLKGKKFTVVGDIKSADPFGWDQCRQGGQMLLITEGELDSAAARQMFKLKKKGYSVCSLKAGCGSVKQLLESHLTEISGYESVVLNFDNDEKGIAAANLMASKLPPGKARIMLTPEGFKDACDMLKDPQGATKYFDQLARAKVFQPGGILRGEETWTRLKNRPKVRSVPYPEDWTVMNEKTYGIRLGELDTWTSGTGMGKTQFLREMQYHLLMSTDSTIGIIALEEPAEDTIESIMSLHVNKRLHLPDVNLSDADERKAWVETWGTNRLVSYDAFGSMDDDNLIDKIRYMAQAQDCKYIFLDHLSIVVSEQADQGNERERIDSVMTRLKKLTQELGVYICLVCHLRKTSGDKKTFEEGAVPTLDDLRGSGAIKQLSNSVFGLARNQKAEDMSERNTTYMHALKCRFTGYTGPTDAMCYDTDTGRLTRAVVFDDYEDNGPINNHGENESDKPRF